jgi:hypothetical protein
VTIHEDRGSGDPSLNVPSFLDSLYNAEHQSMERSLATSSTTALPLEDRLVITPWIERTRWDETYANTNRALLQTFMRLPDRWTRRHGMLLVDGDRKVWSPASAEQQIQRAIHSVDTMFDYCEETVR